MQTDVSRRRRGPMRLVVFAASALMAAGAPAPAPVLAPEALERLSASCDRAIAATNERVEQVGQTAEDIASRQPWAIIKLLAFGAMLFLLAFAIRKW